MKPSQLRPVLAYLVTNWAKGEAVRTLLALVSVAEGAENGQPLTQLDLTRELGIKKPAATHLVSHLVARGVVEQRTDPQHRSYRTLHLTAAGADLLRNAGMTF